MDWIWLRSSSAVSYCLVLRGGLHLGFKLLDGLLVVSV